MWTQKSGALRHRTRGHQHDEDSDEDAGKRSSWERWLKIRGLTLLYFWFPHMCSAWISRVASSLWSTWLKAWTPCHQSSSQETQKKAICVTYIWRHNLVHTQQGLKHFAVLMFRKWEIHCIKSTAWCPQQTQYQVTALPCSESQTTFNIQHHVAHIQRGFLIYRKPYKHVPTSVKKKKKKSWISNPHYITSNHFYWGGKKTHTPQDIVSSKYVQLITRRSHRLGEVYVHPLVLSPSHTNLSVGYGHVYIEK